MKKIKITTWDITQIGLMVAVIEASKFLLAVFPNIELTSFWIILFTLYFGPKIIFVVPVFILIEGLVYGFGSWWIMYLYAWPLLSLLTWFFRKQTSALFFAILSGLFGLFFGALCSIPYFFVGMVDGGILGGFTAAFSWWVAGIPFDITHCIGNFSLMLILYHPVTKIMKKMKSQGFFSSHDHKNRK